MIYDCFSFFNELDLLEIRLDELSSAVDRFVLVEATKTHNGDQKPLYFAENKARFARFGDRIIHVVADDFSGAEQGSTFQERAWMRENIQRNAIAKGLRDARPDDLIIVSDLDEIPRASDVRNAASGYRAGTVVSFELRFYEFYLNLRNFSDPFWGNDPKMADFRTFSSPETYKDAKYTHFILPAVNRGCTATRFRYVKPDMRMPDAGWHFSYLGGIDAVIRKLRAFNEMGLYGKKDLEKFVQKRVASGRSLWGHDHFMPEPVDETFPVCVLAGRERLSHLICEPVPPQGLRIAFLRKWYRAAACVHRWAVNLAFWLTPRWARRIVKRFVIPA